MLPELGKERVWDPWRGEVEDEGQEVRLSISHDGDYATATCLAYEGFGAPSGPVGGDEGLTPNARLNRHEGTVPGAQVDKAERTKPYAGYSPRRLFQTNSQKR